MKKILSTYGVFSLLAVVLLLFGLNISDKNYKIEELNNEIEALELDNEDLSKKLQKADKTTSSKYNSTSSSSKTEDIVYKTKTGSKYHRSYCQHLSKSKISIDRDKAIRQGLTPCSRCNP